MHFWNIVKKMIKKPFSIGILNQYLNYSFVNSTDMSLKYKGSNSTDTFLKYKSSNFTAELF